MLLIPGTCFHSSNQTRQVHLLCSSLPPQCLPPVCNWLRPLHLYINPSLLVLRPHVWLVCVAWQVFASGLKLNRNGSTDFVWCLFLHGGSVLGFCFGLGVSYVNWGLWCDTAQNVEILISLSVSVTKCTMLNKHPFYKRTLMLQKDQSNHKPNTFSLLLFMFLC